MSGDRVYRGWWLLGLILQLSALPALAIDARARAGLELAGDAWIGQQVVLKVELLSNGQSFGGQRIHLPDVPGALVLEDVVSTVKLTEQVNGETWQVLSYRYPMFAQRAGRIELAPIAVAFDVSEGYGSEPVSFELQTEALSFEVRSPPGVDDPARLVTTTDFTLKVEVTPDPVGLKVGDALTRTITRTAPAVSGMAFAPLPTPAIPGVAVYPKSPEVDDRSSRGDLVGTRVESVTYVLQQAGELTIPGIGLQRWDPVAEKMHTDAIPALTLGVAVNPDLLPQFDPVEQLAGLAADHPGALAAGVLCMAAILWAGFRWLPVGIRRLRGWRIARRHSEPARFKGLLRACRGNDPAAVYNAYVHWASADDSPALATTGAKGLADELQRL
ncbi:MAG: hypothetical protein WBM65_06280, partial [Sedimenticolaceae bacterium]